MGKPVADRGEGLRLGFTVRLAELRFRVGLLRGRVLKRGGTGRKAMWVRTTMTTERWTKKKTEDNANIWDENCRAEKARQKSKGGLQGGTVAEDPRKLSR